MTESEWLTCIEPIKMFSHLTHTSPLDDHEPGFQSFVRACRAKFGIVVRKRFSGRRMAQGWCLFPNGDTTQHLADRLKDEQAIAACPLRYRCDLLREIFGNPFRRIMFASVYDFRVRPVEAYTGDTFKHTVILPDEILAWHDRTIPNLAQSIYEREAWGELPILADALEEAGCTNADLLAHCRHPGPHVRGCWAVDLLLGKS